SRRPGIRSRRTSSVHNSETNTKPCLRMVRHDHRAGATPAGGTNGGPLVTTMAAVYPRQSMRDRMRDPDRQKFFFAFMIGKMIGLFAFFAAIFVLAPWIVGKVTHAQGTTEPSITD